MVVDLLVLAAVGLAAGVAAVAPPAQSDAIRRAESRGLTMYWFDRAAWVTSDDLVVRLPAERRQEVGGWIVTQAARGYHVAYVGKAGSADRVVYAANVEGRVVSHPVVYPADREPELQGAERQMADALRAARVEMDRHSEWQPCAPARFNTIVLPPDASGTTSVYFLTPQVETRVIPFGGHYEVDVAANGKITATRPFTKSCIALRPEAEPAGAKPAALFLTHLLDPQPTEIHVFQQLAMGIPLYVGTGPGTVWEVENGAITPVGPPAKPAAPTS